MDALIFDFDGVLVDSEPIHYEGFRRILASRGMVLTEKDYYGKYLGFDDHDAIAAACRDLGCPAGEKQIAAMEAEKSVYLRRILSESAEPMPGAPELIEAATEAGVPLAVCSGALREEVELTLRVFGVIDRFGAIVGAKDVADGKPHPEGYLKACKQLAGRAGRTIHAASCLVVEDSPVGIQAGKAAGMKVLAVTNSYPAEELTEADRIVDSLVGILLDSLSEMF